MNSKRWMPSNSIAILGLGDWFCLALPWDDDGLGSFLVFLDSLAAKEGGPSVTGFGFGSFARSMPKENLFFWPCGSSKRGLQMNMNILLLLCGCGEIDEGCSWSFVSASNVCMNTMIMINEHLYRIRWMDGRIKTKN